MLLGSVGGLITIVLTQFIYPSYYDPNPVTFAEGIVYVIAFGLLMLGFFIVGKKEKNKLLRLSSILMLIMFSIPLFLFGEHLINISLVSFLFGFALLNVVKLAPLTKYAAVLNFIITPIGILELFRYSIYGGVSGTPSIFLGWLVTLFSIALILESYLLYRAREIYGTKAKR